MIYGEAMSEWYEYAAELQESVAETSPVLVLLAAVVGLLLLNFMSQIIILPLAVVVAVYMLQNTLITALVLLGVIHFVGVYYYYNTPQKSAPYLHWDRERTPTSVIGGEGAVKVVQG
uniref:Uncharacterized protein n=1 Tax=Ananas comosus var. bracteatus TaxID=296719 RepID=A0A6V7PJC7_ANACO|nr:unnamed protein product [Ananas comosus var. bracteatus]